jgi:hypothetical protein
MENFSFIIDFPIQTSIDGFSPDFPMIFPFKAPEKSLISQPSGHPASRHQAHGARQPIVTHEVIHRLLDVTPETVARAPLLGKTGTFPKAPNVWDLKTGTITGGI